MLQRISLKTTNLGPFDSLIIFSTIDRHSIRRKKKLLSSPTADQIYDKLEKKDSREENSDRNLFLITDSF
ncbi:MAG: hypothetical protein A2W73_11320 [Deltaproteobacteria bacterium RIFCSPLOWO2_12_55_13]|nr:MAG: hypothetical protein A2X89_09410 [Deltaproteobacteria bacterium GWD2_55_8]OGQ62843.1 MAG: hypothetical protein A2W73_11320 [Deltaproteobacteria bacterium RIFCSPLOWO2_12_55_13]OGQ96656.1 MAG: hypothetical protein A2253_08980 [Deltaproteobacteria bacterium RIFOXYA2_FULL_55_11]